MQNLSRAAMVENCAKIMKKFRIGIVGHGHTAPLTTAALKAMAQAEHNEAEKKIIICESKKVIKMPELPEIKNIIINTRPLDFNKPIGRQARREKRKNKKHGK